MREASLSGVAPGASAPGGSAPGAGPRTEIAASWRRTAARGLDPGADPQVALLTESELERRRADSALAPLVPQLLASLVSVATAAGHAAFQHYAWRAPDTEAHAQASSVPTTKAHMQHTLKSNNL